MAVVVVNATLQGPQKPGGQQRAIVSRGSVIAGDVTVAFNSATVMTKGQLLQVVQQCASTLSDQLK